MDKGLLFVDFLLVLFVLYAVDAISISIDEPIDDDDEDSSSWSRCPFIRNKLKNGRVKLRSRGRIAKFMCDPGYELAGKRFTTCVRGQWNYPIPMCVSRGCSRPPVVANARVSEMYRGAVLLYECLPGYSMQGGASVYCDGRQWSSEAPMCEVSTTNPQISCDFEDPDLCGWSHDPTHDFDWKRNQFATPSGHVGTGPTSDHTFGPGKGGFYIYMEASSPRKVNDTARLFSPVYSKEYSGGCFVFWYHMFGSTTGGLRVYVKPESHVFGELLPTWTEYGDQGNQWLRGNVTVSQFNQNFQIVIEGIRGSNYIGDTAIDDVTLSPGDCSLIGNFTDHTTEFVSTSCRGRCREANDSYPCGCNDDCAPSGPGIPCCEDFSELCTKRPDGTENPEEYSASVTTPKPAEVKTSPKTDTTTSIQTVTSHISTAPSISPVSSSVPTIADNSTSSTTPASTATTLIFSTSTIPTLTVMTSTSTTTTLSSTSSISPTASTTPSAISNSPSAFSTTPSTISTASSTTSITPSTISTTPSTISTTPSTTSTTPSTIFTTISTSLATPSTISITTSTTSAMPSTTLTTPSKPSTTPSTITTTSYTKSTTSYTKSTPSYMKSTTSFTKSTPSYMKSNTSFTTSTPSYLKSTTSFTKSTPSYMKSTTSFTKSTPSYMKSTTSFTKSTPSYMKSTTSFTKSTPSYMKSTTSFTKSTQLSTTSTTPSRTSTGPSRTTITPFMPSRTSTMSPTSSVTYFTTTIKPFTTSTVSPTKFTTSPSTSSRPSTTAVKTATSTVSTKVTPLILTSTVMTTSTASPSPISTITKPTIPSYPNTVSTKTTMQYTTVYPVTVEETRRTYNLRPRYRTTPTPLTRIYYRSTTQRYYRLTTKSTTRMPYAHFLTIQPSSTTITSTSTSLITSTELLSPTSSSSTTKTASKPTDRTSVSKEAKHSSTSASTIPDSSRSTVTIVSVLLMSAACIAGVLIFYFRRWKAKRHSKLADDSEMRFLYENEFVEFSDVSALDKMNFNNPLI